MPTQTTSFGGFRAMGIFLFFGAVMASVAGTTLLWPGTFLDRLWVLNARAYNQLAHLGNAPGIVFLLLGATLAIAGAGWFRCRLWGWFLAVIVISTQVMGNLVNAMRGHLLRGGAGSLLAGALLYFLLRPQVRGVFARGARRGVSQ